MRDHPHHPPIIHSFFCRCRDCEDLNSPATIDRDLRALGVALAVALFVIVVATLVALAPDIAAWLGAAAVIS